MLKSFSFTSVVCLLALTATPVLASGLLVSSNGFVQIGINDDGSLDANTSAGFVGIGYNFTGQGGRSGYQDVLTPGCPCEAWGVSANGTGGQVGQQTGNQNISVGTPTSTPVSFTSVTGLATIPGLSVTQSYALGAQTATGALFTDTVTIRNGTGSLLTDVRYARAMDWDVPPTEFAEIVTIKGTRTTSTLLHSTDDGFANADPITAVSNTGIVGPNDSDGTTGPADHGSLFVFGFGDLAAGADYTFKIFYGAGANGDDALSLLGQVSPELYSLGQSNNGAGGAAMDLPTYLFAFSGVGGSVVVPPSPVPLPASLPLFGGAIIGIGIGTLGLGMKRKQAAKTA